MLAKIPCLQLNGVGPQITKLLEKINVATVQDLLFHLPSSYQDRSCVIPIHQLKNDEQVLVEGEIVNVETTYSYRSNLICQINDGTGDLFVRFLHYTSQQKQFIKIGSKMRCYGVVRLGRYGFEMIHLPGTSVQGKNGADLRMTIDILEDMQLFPAKVLKICLMMLKMLSSPGLMPGRLQKWKAFLKNRNLLI